MTAPKPKGVSMRELKQKAGKEHESSREKIKDIVFPLPDLRGPEGNAWALLGTATQLMKEQGIPNFLQVEFHREASAGDFAHLVKTIREWFTLAVPTVTYAPVPDDVPLEDILPSTDEDEDEIDGPQ